jgi:hypothetical protein
MPDVGFLNLFAVALVAFGVPLLLGLAPWLRIPGPVLEIVAGVVLRSWSATTCPAPTAPGVTDEEF